MTTASPNRRPLGRAGLRSSATALVVVGLVSLSGCGGGGSGSDPTAVTAPTGSTGSTASGETSGTAPAPGSTTAAAKPGSGPAPTPPQPAPTASSGGAGGGVHAVDWANRTLERDACEDGGAPAQGYALRNGRAELQQGNFTYVTAGDGLVFGDLTGDGRDEVVVTVRCGTGAGTQIFSYVYTAGTGAAPVQRLGTVFLDQWIRKSKDQAAYARFFDAAVDGGVLVTRWSVQLPADPNCCPSQVVTVRKRWTGSEWQDQGVPEFRDRASIG